MHTLVFCKCLATSGDLTRYPSFRNDSYNAETLIVAKATPFHLKLTLIIAIFVSLPFLSSLQPQSLFSLHPLSADMTFNLISDLGSPAHRRAFSGCYRISYGVNDGGQWEISEARERFFRDRRQRASSMSRIGKGLI